MEATALSELGAPARGQGDEQPVERWTRLVAHRLLSVPILYKVLVANSAIVVLGAVLGTWLTVHYGQVEPGRSSEELVAVFVLAGVALCIVVNFLVLKAALLPLAALERAVEDVRNGNLKARAGRVAFSDPQVDQLADTLNSMLDGLENYREQVRWLSRQVLTAQEEERQRIARELHDETAQSLTSLLIGLRVLEKASAPDELATRIVDLRSQTSRMLVEVRKMAVDLRPSTLDDLGLAAALQWYTDDFAERTRILVDFRATGLDERLSDDVQVVIYRIVQEALTNVAKHAEASRVAVRVQVSRDGIAATVTDDGRGFDVPAVLGSRERGLGLFGMRERVSLVGGTLRIGSEPETGTEVEIKIPVGGLLVSRVTSDG
jgi:two-component system, NarL family, sensor histidine kinase UhpB